MDNIFLYGPSGAGKTSVGKRLAERLDRRFIDLDRQIEAEAGIAIREIFENDGEAAFRALENRALQGAIRSAPGALIALGGGALLDAGSRALAEGHGKILCLTANPSVLMQRLLTDKADRPLLVGDPETRLQEYLETRAGHYASFPAQLATDGLTAHEAAREAQKALGFFRLRGMDRPYDVRIDPGGLPGLSRRLLERDLKGPVCLVADENTRPYAEKAGEGLRRAGFDAQLTSFPPGEGHKNLATVESLWGAFLECKIERGSTIIAVGGGVTGDLAGFAASTYLRGVPWVVVPTSLLAMVDAGLGGKTGADLPQGKNLIGAFHAPRLVLVDPDVLATLPERELRAGMAEVIKAGVIGDPALFEACSRLTSMDISPELISAAMAVKIDIVERDPYESGLRAVLNFGHTFGHAVEHASHYELLHGEAVAIGMAAETQMAERLGIAAAGLTRKIRYCLSVAGLPVNLPENLNREQILGAMKLDKKKKGGVLRFALPLRIGDVSLVDIPARQYEGLLWGQLRDGSTHSSK